MGTFRNLQVNEAYWNNTYKVFETVMLAYPKITKGSLVIPKTTVQNVDDQCLRL